jgi:predicted Fe-Mo cluster-binding NifX family protein
MKIGVPIIEPNGMASEVNDHFGMSEHFAILEVEGDDIKGLEFIRESPSLKEHRTPPGLLAEHGVEVVLAGGIGPHMIEELLDKGIKIFRGAAGTIEQAFEDYKAGMLSQAKSI